VRENQFNGCTWLFAGTYLRWATPGGDYRASMGCSGILGYNEESVAIIDVTKIYRKKFEDYKKSGEWNDYGIIIMRDPKVASECSFVTIYSLESRPSGDKLLSPQLFLE
jgi:hypothetical protein